MSDIPTMRRTDEPASDAVPVLGPADGGFASANQAADWIKRAALEVGFDLVGITMLAPSPRAAYVEQWFADAAHGSMDYLQRHAPVKLDAGRRWPWAKAVIVLGLSYPPPASDRPRNAPPQRDDLSCGRGKIAAYAVGRDYHRVVSKLTKRLARRLSEKWGAAFRGVAATDATPLMERELAARAGIGWIGKNTMVIHPAKGSWMVLGELLTNLDITVDQPMADHCGSCRRCIEACPTAALTPYQMNASRCISYQLIENRGPIPDEFHAAIAGAGFVIGCDICQSVCPHNTKAPAGNGHLWGDSPTASVSLADILTSDWSSWDQLTRGRATRRARPEMWKRNAEILEQNKSG